MADDHPVDAAARERLERYVEHLVATGERLDIATLCTGRQELRSTVARLLERHDRIAGMLGSPTPEPPPSVPTLPEIPGFDILERIGGGGGGEVYRAVDLELGRTVALKRLRPDSALGGDSAAALREARVQALFEDPRIVRLHALRTDLEPPVLVMEHVDGFELGVIGPSLEPRQRARLLAEVAEAVHRAHELGVQHRDLKLANVLVDASLAPHILDFGLARGERHLGHGLGTPPSMAPEQLDPARPIDRRTDVYALGVMLYELLAGRPPYLAEDDGELAALIRRGRPPLPAELAPDVPDALQAIALQAMAADPAERYPTARELALDLRRFLEGRPVQARPARLRSALADRVRGHLAEIRDWLRIGLVEPHEAERLAAAYGRLEEREDDWIVHGRRLSLDRVLLYLGVAVVAAGGVLLAVASLLDATSGALRPLLQLGLPLAALAAAARGAEARDRRGVAVAFSLATALLVPLVVLLVLRGGELLLPLADDPSELLGGGFSNRQLQLAGAAGVAWALRLALRTRTLALGTALVAQVVLLHLALLGDLGLRRVVEDGRWDLLALRLLPLVAGLAAIGGIAERRTRSWIARPAYLGATVTLVAAFELATLDGRALRLLGLSLATLHGPEVSDPRLLDTLAGMAAVGVLLYFLALAVERVGTPLLRGSSRLLLAVAPFAVLEPMLWLCRTGEYWPGFDVVFLTLAVATALASHLRQRRSFFLAGASNSMAALWILTDHRDWFERPSWSAVVVVAGLGLLALGGWLGSRSAGDRPR